MKQTAQLGIAFLCLLGFGYFVYTQASSVPTIPRKQVPQVSPKPMPTADLTVYVTEDRLWTAVQEWRESQAKPTYTKNEVLCRHAEERSKEIKQDWSHYGFRAKHSKQIYAETEFVALGENLVKGDVLTTSVLEGWLNSPKHRENLDENFTHSCIKCTDFFCVQLFGKY